MEPEKVPRRKIRLGILGSTRGTDLEAMIDAAAAGTLPAEIVLVISDRRSAFILERAERHGIPARFLSPYRSDENPTQRTEEAGTGSGSSVGSGKSENRRLDREAYDRLLDRVLREAGVDLVVLIGFMRILSPFFCSAWEGKIINVHPSLLPAFSGGMDGDVHRAVIAAKCRESGCTVHLATADLDAGPILVQKRCPVDPDETPETLKCKVQEMEGQALIEAVGLIGREAAFPETVFRTLGPGDAEAFRQLVDEIRDEERWLFVTRRFTREQTEAYVIHHCRSETAIWGAFSYEGQLLGWADFNPGGFPEIAHVALLGMGIRRGFRGRGLGKALLGRCLESARAVGVEKMELEVFSGNEAAIALYRSMGFQEEGRKIRSRKYAGRYDDILCMGRFLLPEARESAPGQTGREE